ncbi:MAG: hypothetical protein U5R31_14685 [Acidimicrobiia bacterium]|nr:hypothetical protein [Acidimicrobiia bacterium]
MWLLVAIAFAGGDERGERDDRIDPEWWVRVALVLIGLSYFFPGLAKAEMLPEFELSHDTDELVELLEPRFDQPVTVHREVVDVRATAHRGPDGAGS